MGRFNYDHLRIVNPSLHLIAKDYLNHLHGQNKDLKSQANFRKIKYNLSSIHFYNSHLFYKI